MKFIAHDVPSTYDLVMNDPKRRKRFEEEYRSFVLVEILIPLLKKSEMSVRALAEAAGVSPTVIQEIKSGRKEGVAYSTFLSILGALGYEVVLQVIKKNRSVRSRSRTKRGGKIVQSRRNKSLPSLKP